VLETNSLELQRAAVIAGEGIAMSFEGFYRDLLASGAIQEILEDWSMPFSGPFLYYSGRKLLPAPLRAFIDFVKAWQPPRKG
jgi:DNA-binding transcriptional LysR family regulator